MANTLRGVRLYSKFKNADDFATALEPALQEVLTKYKSAGKPVGDLSQKIERLECGKGTMSYVMLRAYAEYLGVPTGLLILYSHTIGHVSRGQPIEVSSVLRKTIAALEVLCDFAERSDAHGSELVVPREGSDLGDGRYIVQSKALGEVLRAYRRAK